MGCQSNLKQALLITVACCLALVTLALLNTPRATTDAAPPPEAASMLAYIQGGDVWVKELPDGEPRRLTTDAQNRSPRWSVSGGWVAFYKGASPSILLPQSEQLWVIGQSGAGARMMEGGGIPISFEWSPVSDTLAYTTAAGDLDVAGAPDWQPHVLIAGSTGNGVPAVESAAWSYDGPWLAFNRQEAAPGHVAGQPAKLAVSLWKIRSDGTGALELYDAGALAEDGIITVSWSRTGRQVLFWLDPFFSGSILADGVPLQAISINGGKPYTLTTEMLLHSDWMDSYSDGWLAVTEGGDRETWTNKHIILVDPASGNKMQLTDDKTAAFSPAWSPDGQRIAYVAAPDIAAVGGGNEAKAGAAKRRIWVMNRDGSGKRPVTKDPAYRDERPLWSGDGRYIIFARLDNSSDKTSLWLIPSEGGEPVRVVTELDPLPPESTWFGYYGHIDWGDYFDLWTPPSPTQPPETGGALPDSAVIILVGALALMVGAGILLILRLFLTGVER